MKDRKESQQVPVCPSCGRPIKSGLLRFKIDDNFKILFDMLLFGYVALSIFLLIVNLYPEMKRECDSYPPQQQPDSCSDDMLYLLTKPLYSLMEPLYREPGFQRFIGGGLAAGVLSVYWDWFQGLYENWQKKRKSLRSKSGNLYQYECCSCGRQWN